MLKSLCREQGKKTGSASGNKMLSDELSSCKNVIVDIITFFQNSAFFITLKVLVS